MYIASFYRFTTIDKLTQMADFVDSLCSERGVKGTVILADEGINAVLAHPDETALKAIIARLENIDGFANLRPTVTLGQAESNPFNKLRVRIRSEIVTYGKKFDFNLPKLPRASATQWANLICLDDTIVLDVRNQYEHVLGRFKNSVHPSTNSFREFEDFLHRQTDIDREHTIAIYCTGGIRCEKAAQSMQKCGFKSVVQLDRGILGYLEEAQDQSLWEGECFVFDQRVAVNETLEEGSSELCLACGHPLTPEAKNSFWFNFGISCSSCVNDLSPASVARRTERLHQLELTRQREKRSERERDTIPKDCAI